MTNICNLNIFLMRHKLITWVKIIFRRYFQTNFSSEYSKNIKMIEIMIMLFYALKSVSF